MSKRHVVIGAGPVGTSVARQLAEKGDHVVVVVRTRMPEPVLGVDVVPADASDAAALTDIAQGAAVIYNCANPKYHQWHRDWPPLLNSMLQAAEKTGAVLASTSNLYVYGRPTAAMRESDPMAFLNDKGQIRADMWRQMLDAHDAGRVRVTEVRGSDYFGPGVVSSSMGLRTWQAVLAGKAANLIGKPDVAHSWTYTPDVATALITAASDERGLGKAWHVPTNAPLTQRELLNAFAEAAGAPAPKMRMASKLMLQAIGLFNKELAEMPKVLYQFENPFIIDSSAFTATFGIQATPFAEALAATAAWAKASSAK
jgi:nucleoside-diphosphate-sugar epimerase